MTKLSCAYFMFFPYLLCLFSQTIDATPVRTHVSREREILKKRNASAQRHTGSTLSGLGDVVGGVFGTLGSIVELQGSALAAVHNGNAAALEAVYDTNVAALEAVHSGNVAAYEYLHGLREERKGDPSSTVSIAPPTSQMDPNRAASMSVTTKKEIIYCWKYPDTITSDITKVPTIPRSSNINVSCWTDSNMKDFTGKVSDNGTWLRTNFGGKECYINEANLKDKQDYRSRLNFCGYSTHWIGTVQQQYNQIGRADCFACTSLDCPSKNLGKPLYVDLACYAEGEVVKGDNTWLQTKDENCYFPAAMFNPNGWLGTPGGRCAK